MSDPVSSAEIEDVLTSIRRLVSENRPLADVNSAVDTHYDKAPDATGDAIVARLPRASTEAPLALVLTAAHRVEDVDGEEASAESDWASEDVDQKEDGFLEVDVHDGDIAEALGVDDLIEAEPFLSSPLDIQAGDDATPLGGEPQYDPNHDEGDVFAEDDAPFMAQDATVSEIEEWTADIGEIDSFDERTEVPVEALPAASHAGEEPVDEEQPFDFKQVLEARIHHFRDAAEPAEVFQETDVRATSRQGGLRAPAWGAAEHLDAVSESFSQTLEGKLSKEITDAVDFQDVTELAGAADDTSEIDEAMLREMVSDIVRQELQGALGERITRNVRKLVRREIHRALAAHDLS